MNECMEVNNSYTSTIIKVTPYANSHPPFTCMFLIALTGRSKAMVEQKYGPKQFKAWRRGKL